MNKIDVMFVVIAERDAQYYHNIAIKLRDNKIRCGFIVFHEPALDVLGQDNGFVTFLPFKSNAVHDQEYFETKYDLVYNDIVRHEYLTYLGDPEKIKKKLSHYMGALEAFFEKNSVSCVVQELGGHIGCLSVYECSKYAGVEHYFIEPSFFKNRVIFLRNTIEPMCTDLVSDRSKYVDDYIKEYQKNKFVSFSGKDNHHYNKAYKKIFLLRNWKALIYKTYNIYIRGRHIEFDSISSYVGKYVRFIVSSFLCNILGRYQPLDKLDSKRFVYFPLHVPEDFQLTTRCPEIYDQYAILLYLSSIMPSGVSLVTKEHPSMAGSFGCLKSRAILNSGLVLLSPYVNNYDVISRSELVITINSKSGFEAIIQGKQVVALGDSFYSCAGLTRNMSVRELRNKISFLLEQDCKVDIDVLFGLLNGIYKRSFPVDLYDNSEENINNSVKAIRSLLV